MPVLGESQRVRTLSVWMYIYAHTYASKDRHARLHTDTVGMGAYFYLSLVSLLPFAFRFLPFACCKVLKFSSECLIFVANRQLICYVFLCF